MGETQEKKSKEMTPRGGGASESPGRELGRGPDPKLVPMGQSRSASQRRSQRVFFRTPVVIYGKHPDGSIYCENSNTVIVSAHGAMVLLAADVKAKERLLMVNQLNRLESECYVASFGEIQEGKREVGIGFVEPAPQFWGLNFPPDDWDPSTRKKPTSKAP